MSIYNYFNLYSLDYSKVDSLKQLIANHKDPLQQELSDALNGTTIQAKLAENAMHTNALSAALEVMSGSPGVFIIENTLQSTKQTDDYLRKLLEQFSGTNPFAVQALVHRILGIAGSQEPLFSEAQLRQEYFLEMKQSAFLRSDCASINTAQEQPIVHQTETYVSTFLNEHPEIQTLALGCGEVGQTYSASCYFRRIEDHKQKVFAVDIAAGNGADVIANMHDLSLWKAIPNERFDCIADHTYSFVLFEDPLAQETIREIHRTLKPGGQLKFDHHFEQAQIEMLERSGFKMDESNPKWAIKA